MGDAGKQDESKSGKRWFPLESNPEVMTSYSQRLGLAETLQWHDVFAVEDWALEMVPTPVKAVVMLFPISEASEAHKSEEARKIEAEGQEVSDSVYYMEQTVGNACGTVGIMHALLNNLEEGTVPRSYIRQFFEETAGMSSEERAAYLEGNNDIDTMHVEAASQGQSDQVDIEDSVITHFVAFVHVDGALYELDGRKKHPVNHGPSSASTLLQDAVQVVKQFMARDPEELRFTMTALAPANV